MSKRMTFWMTSEYLFSNQPSAIQAMDATIKIAKPATVMRALTLAATMAAARIVVQAAKVLSIASSSLFFPKTKGLPDWHGQPCLQLPHVSQAAVQCTLWSA